jgi:hypothetical protein
MECERGGRVEDGAAEVSEAGPGSTQADCVRVPVSPDLFAKGPSVCQVLTRPPNASAGSRKAPKVKDCGGPGGRGSTSIVLVVVVRPRFIGGDLHNKKLWDSLLRNGGAECRACRSKVCESRKRRTKSSSKEARSKQSNERQLCPCSDDPVGHGMEGQSTGRNGQLEETQHDPLTSIIGAGGQGAKRQTPSRTRGWGGDGQLYCNLVNC